MRGHAHVIAQRVDHAKEQQSAGIAEAATISLAMIKSESGEQEIFADRLSREVGLIVVGCHFIRPLAALATRQRRIPAVWVRQTNQAAGLHMGRRDGLHFDTPAPSDLGLQDGQWRSEEHTSE